MFFTVHLKSAVLNPGGPTPTATPTPGGPTLLPVPQYTLVTEKTGMRNGAVIGEGIDCGTICKKSYPRGTGLILKAIPDAGSAFTGWEVNGILGECLVRYGRNFTIFGPKIFVIGIGSFCQVLIAI